MDTTVGFFYTEALQSGYTIRAGKAALPLHPDEVAGVLPVLVRLPIAARSLTDIIPYPNLFSAMTAQGWQDVNFLFDGHAWYELTDLLGTRGERLQGPPAGGEAEEEARHEHASEKQIDAIKRMTKSHVFDPDRDALIRSVHNATLDQASKLYEYVKAELARRPRLYPAGGREAYYRALGQGLAAR